MIMVTKSRPILLLSSAGPLKIRSEEKLIVLKLVAAIRDISRSCLDPNDFAVLNCIVKGHASLSPLPCGFVCVRVSPYLLLRPILILKVLVLTPSTVSKVMRPFHPLLHKKQRKK
ncbi:uncharacterized protein TNCV_3596041 [Trichonephila clavipes]|nr:uncharacterized protein TNCV_3596041 [Trichonephila clavipes]